MLLVLTGYLGHFVWDGENFSQSAENIRFSLEADGQAAVLRASLSNSGGQHEERDINLGERIGNDNGNFSYSMETLSFNLATGLTLRSD